MLEQIVGKDLFQAQRRVGAFTSADQRVGVGRKAVLRRIRYASPSR